MTATIEDVAREAHVSIATVSRYTNGRVARMSSATQERLRITIDRLGYIPNAAARTLKTGRTRLVGVVLADIAHMYWSTMLAGIEEGCQELGYGVLISSASNSAESQNKYLDALSRQKVDGFLLNPVMADPRTITSWATLRQPVIMLDRTFPGLGYPLVAVDNVRGAQLAARHLLDHGHRAIAFISWEINGLGNRQERLDGFTSTLRSAGVRPSARHIAFARVSWDDGVRATIDLFGASDRPTAVFSANMELNLQVLAGLKQLGLRVPDDVSVIGFDDAPWDPLLDPPLTAINTPPFRLGKLAALRLCRAIERRVPPAAHDSRLQPELVERMSVADIRSGWMPKQRKTSVHSV
jgi:DNA-binding LacI/PurR family transcriptional regulator